MESVIYWHGKRPGGPTMKKYFVLSGALCLTILLSTFWQARVTAANTPGTRLLRTPTASATQIAFAYANNIWVVDRAGGSARRLTSFQGQTGNPHFSPDGKTI